MRRTQTFGDLQGIRWPVSLKVEDHQGIQVVRIARGRFGFLVAVQCFEQQGQVVLDPRALGQAGSRIAQVNHRLIIGSFLGQQKGTHGCVQGIEKTNGLGVDLNPPASQGILQPINFADNRGGNNRYSFSFWIQPFSFRLFLVMMNNRRSSYLQGRELFHGIEH
jgi:hypothetical protein